MRTIIATTLLALAIISPAAADKRVALVIGNSSYQNTAQLRNPVNDADAMSATFKKAGFDVVESRRDLKISETRRVLRDFSDKALDADVAVIYYAGHGMEVDGSNYLIPVDAALERDADVFDETIPLDRLLLTIEPAKKLRLVILDACRDNPFSRTMKRTMGSRSMTRGFAKVEPSSPNTLVAFAAKAGSTAADGDSNNSPFTTALVKHIATPGLDLRKAFGFIRDDVLQVTSNRQEPFVYGSLGGNDVSLVPAVAVPQAPAVNANDGARRDYEFAERVGSLDAWDSFIKNYPSGFYTDLATAQRRKLVAEVARVEATEKARQATQESFRLAGESAEKNEQDAAAARARDAEQERLAAEQTKRDEDARVTAAEKAKTDLEAQAKAAEQQRLTAEKLAAERKQPEDKTIAAKAPEEQIAALAPPAPPDTAAPSQSLNRQLQTELKRVGCYTASLSDNWGPPAQRSLEQFNKRAGLKLDVQAVDLNTLAAVRGKTERVCPPGETEGQRKRQRYY